MWLFILALYSTGIVTELPSNKYLHLGALNSTTTLYLADYYSCDVVEICYEHFLETGNSTGFYCRVITVSLTNTATCLFRDNYCRKYCENMINFTRPTPQLTSTPMKTIKPRTKKTPPKINVLLTQQLLFFSLTQ